MKQTKPMGAWAMSLRRPGETQGDTARLSVEELCARQSVRTRVRARVDMVRGRKRPARGSIVNLAETDSRGQVADPEITRLVEQSEREHEAKSLAEARLEIARYQPQEEKGMSKTKTKGQPPSARDKKVVEKWDNAVRETMIDRALLKSEAVRFLAVNEPGLHSDYLASYNRIAQRGKDLRMARAAVRRGNRK